MARSAGVGTILLRNFALGASTPWELASVLSCMLSAITFEPVSLTSR